MREELESGLLVWFWLGVIEEVSVKLWPGLWSSEDLTGAGGSTSKVVRSLGWRAGAGCGWRRPSIPSQVGFSNTAT